MFQPDKTVGVVQILAMAIKDENYLKANLWSVVSLAESKNKSSVLAILNVFNSC